MENNLIIVFQKLLEFSLILSAQLLFILLLRKKVCHWFGAVNAYRLWLLPLLCMPLYFVELSGLNITGWFTSLFSQGELQPEVEGFLISTAIPAMLSEIPLPAWPEMITQKTTAEFFWQGVSIFWLSGLLLLCVREVFRISKFNSFVKQNVSKQRSAIEEKELSESLMHSVSINFLVDLESPAIYGILKPKLLLPAEFLSRYDTDQQRMILFHESVHASRFDNFWNLLAFLLKIINWFNPLVYVAHRCYRLDQELSCDALALEKCNPEQQKRYARTLFQSLEQTRVNRIPPMIAAWENPGDIKHRLESVGNELRLGSSKLTGVLCLLFLMLSGAGITSCVSDSVDVSPINRAVGQTDAGEALSDGVRNVINQVVKLRDEGNYERAELMLDLLRLRYEQGELNSREQYVLWQFYANIYQIQERYTEAINAYRIMEKMPSLTVEQQQQILYYLGNLYFVRGLYADAIESYGNLEIDSQAGRFPNSLAQLHYRLAFAYFQLKQPYQALVNLEQHIERYEGEVPRNSYAFLRSLYLLTNQQDKAEEVARTMVELFENLTDRSILEAVIVLKQQPENAHLNYLSIGDMVDELAGEIDSQDNVTMMPLVSYEPQYPKSAVDMKTEGWALTSFTVNAEGEVINPILVDSEPKGIFDDASLAAISKFRFVPRVVEGDVVDVDGVRYLFRFNLAGE